MDGTMGLFATSGSGLRAATAMLNTTASNLANLETPGYKAHRVNLASAAEGDMAVSSTSPDPSVGPLNEEGLEGSNVDPAKELVKLISAKVLYNANAVLLRAASEMTGTLLDIFDDQRR